MIKSEPVGLTCPKCEAALERCYTRQAKGYIRRVRQCPACKDKFVTHEKIVPTLPRGNDSEKK